LQVWEGKEVIKYGRTMIGATNPLASNPGTIRGDYGVDVGRCGGALSCPPPAPGAWRSPGLAEPRGCLAGAVERPGA